MNICELYVLICIQGRLQATVRNFRVNDLWKIGSREYFHKIQKTQYFFEGLPQLCVDLSQLKIRGACTLVVIRMASPV